MSVDVTIVRNVCSVFEGLGLSGVAAGVIRVDVL